MRTVMKPAPAIMREALAAHIGRPLESTLWSICKADARRAITFYVFSDHGGIHRAYFRLNGAFTFACVGKTRDSTVARAILIIGANARRDGPDIVIRESGTCSICKWFDSDFAPDPNPEDALGLCLWPAARLPFSLRKGMANRERAAVGPNEGGDCPTFEIDRHATE